MHSSAPIRRLVPALASGLLLCASSLPALAGGRNWQGTAPIGQRGGSYSQQQRGGGYPQQLGPRPGQEHLSQWLTHHSNLPAPEQQRALEREPGFRDLSPQVQQRMRDRLIQLNNLPPQQRQHILDRAEAMEHLAPEQRQRVRGTMQQLGSLPQDRRRAVSRAFRELRNLPPDQRQQAIDSGHFSPDFSPEERSTLNNLNAVEPLLPPPPPRASFGNDPPPPR